MVVGSFWGPGFFLQDCGGQDAGAVCLWSWWGLEVFESGEEEISPGVVGLVAQDGAAGVVGDDSGDAYQPQADRPGLPGAGGGVGQGEQLGEGQQVTGQSHDQAPDPVGRKPLQGKAVKPGVLGTADTVLAAGPQPVAHLEIGELTHPRAGGEGGGPVVPDVLEA